MGFLAQAFARKSGDPLAIFREIYGSKASWSGKTVTVETAIQVATVFACCRVLGHGLAQVPFKLMQESGDGKTRLPAKTHHLYDKLKTKPNRWQTSFEYREMIGWHLALATNHYSFINRQGPTIIELFPFTPGMVETKRAKDATLSYEVTSENGEKQLFPAEAIWHIRGPSWNSWHGLEALKIAREAIGLSIALEETQARMQKNGVRNSGVYSVEGKLVGDQYKELSKWIDEQIAGPDNAGKAMILDRGAKWLQTSMNNVEGQALEMRRFQVEEVCRHMGVNPILVFAESKNTTYASAEQMFLAHVVHTMSPLWERVEQSADANLLTERDRRQGFYTNFVEEGLIRGTATVEHQMIRDDVNAGLITPNEGRAKMDLNPDSDPASDKLRIPANITGTVPQAEPAA